MKNGKMSGLVVLALFAALAVSVLAVTVTGAGAYSRLTERDDAAYLRRTVEGYLTTRVRSAEAVSLEELQEMPVLTIAESDFVTQIYVYEGWLCELYHTPGSGLGLADGEQLLPMLAMEAELSDGLLTLRLTCPDGAERVLHHALREVAP